MEKQRKLPRQVVFLANFAFIACFFFGSVDIACFCACTWGAPGRNPHQVDEKLFQDLFLFFILCLFGSLPHHKRPKKHFPNRPADGLSNRYDTSCNTHAAQGNVAGIVASILRSANTFWALANQYTCLQLPDRTLLAFRAGLRELSGRT